MLLLTTYRVRPFLTQEETRELMDAFAEFGTTEGTISHYAFADGGGGFVIVETDDAGAAYRNILNYGQWVEYETQVILTIEDAVPHILDALS